MIPLASPNLLPYNVSIDTKCVGVLAADFFKCCGARNIAVITGYVPSPIHSEYLDSFHSGCADNGIAVSRHEYSHDSYEVAYEAADKIIKVGGVDGIFITSYVAPAVCRRI